MARQGNGSMLQGTIDHLTFYVMNGKGFVRRKSSLTRKRILKDKKFESTRKHARDLGIAARIGSSIYRALPLDDKSRLHYRVVSGEAASLLYKGKTEEEVTTFLWNKYIVEPLSLNTNTATQSGEINGPVVSKQTRTALWRIFRDRWEEQDKSPQLFKQLWERRGKFKKYEVPKRLGFMPAM